MTAKKTTAPKVDLKDEINRLMSPDAAKELQGLSPTFQQFLIRWVDLRDFAIMDEMKEFVQELYERDNAELCKNVSTIVCKDVAETIAPIWKKLEELAKGQKSIIDTLDAMNRRMEITEKQVFETDEIRLKNLERYASVGWTIIRNAVSIIIAVGISIIAFFQIHKVL